MSQPLTASFTPNPALDIAGMVLIGIVCGFALYLLAKSVWRSHREYPFSERLCLRVLRVGAWLECVGWAYDRAIIEYRIERRNAAVIELVSTGQRIEAARIEEQLAQGE